MSDFTPREHRVRLEDGRTGTEHRAPIDSLWSVTLDDGEVLFYSILDNRPGKPPRADRIPYTYLED